MESFGPSSFACSKSEEHVESFGPFSLQKHNVMCVSLSSHPLIQEKRKKEKRDFILQSIYYMNYFWHVEIFLRR